MLYLIYLLIVGCITLILFGITSRTPGVIHSQDKHLAIAESGYFKKQGIARYLNPLSAISKLILNRLNLREKLYQKLHGAHLRLLPEDFLSIKLVLMALLAVVSFLEFKADLLPIFIALAVGYILPELWLKRKITQYKQIIGSAVPEVVDLLGLCIEAGLDFTSAMDWIIKRIKPTALIEELAFVLEEIKWGKSRGQALKDMAKKLDIPEMTSFSQILVQAERMGTPVVEVFGILSEDTRQKRYRRGERQALQAPIKMLIPLIFCILPVIAIVVAGPIVIRFTQGGLMPGF